MLAEGGMWTVQAGAVGLRGKPALADGKVLILSAAMLPKLSKSQESNNFLSLKCVSVNLLAHLKHLLLPICESPLFLNMIKS